MAWNEPGGGNKDPWSGKSGDQGPPDLDEVVRKLQERLGGLFGGKKSSGGGPRGGGGGFNSKLIGIAAAILFVIWIASGIYIVDPAERGVILRFGAYTEVTQPGPHWHIPYPVEEVVKVDVDRISSFRHKAAMLTKDENIVDVELTVQYRVQDAADFLFQVKEPEDTLKDATETAVRETIGQSRLDFILTEGRSAVAETIRTGLQALMNQYKTGLEATSVNMQPAKPPEEVKEAFDDAIKAREDKERLENKAEAYANEVLPKARGAAARIVAAAKGYRDKVIAVAEGETTRFLAILQEYQKAPQVTRERLYLETVEQVMAESPVVMVDVEGNNNLMYLPLDRMMRQSGSGEGNPGMSMTPLDTHEQQSTAQQREVNRGRRAR